ncbi:MAG: hypothetical protein ACYDGR_06120 [Candidatus Dormibacteria bacterium]
MLAHIASIMVVLTIHGAVLAVMIALKGERRPERIGALLDLSFLSFDSATVLGRLFWISLLVATLSGGALMLIGGSWHHWWPWISVVLFLAVFVAMSRMGRPPMNDLRRAAGMPWLKRAGRAREWAPAGNYDVDEVASALAGIRPGLLSAIGGCGFATILALMVFRPF